MSWVIEPTFITFIIPTLGRPALKRTIQSVLDQTEWNWKCNIVFDGITPIEITGLKPDIDYMSDNHFRIIVTDKLAHAGLVRNVGIKYADTEWLAFIDDDDYIDPDYIETLRKYQEYDLVIFTYEDIYSGKMLPPKHHKDFISCSVGISFAVKRKFVSENSIEFTKFSVEDFDFLDKCRKAGAKYILTHEVKYRVGGIGGWRK